jgi:hypothetical protein
MNLSAPGKHLIWSAFTGGCSGAGRCGSRTDLTAGVDQQAESKVCSKIFHECRESGDNVDQMSCAASHP